jgi:ketosteroid isomerase-like protein
MYHRFVRKKTDEFFEHLSSGNVDAVLKSMRDDVTFTYPGDHPLAATLHSREALRAWLERFFRVFGGIEFDLHDVAVVGAPRFTRVGVHWTAQATLENGYRYEDEGLHIIHLQGPKVSAVRVYLDTQRTAAAFASLSESGFAEATAPPIAEVTPAR